MQTQDFIFTEWVRTQIRDRMGELGRTLHRLGVHPDMITLLGLVIVAIASVIIARGQFQLGGIILVAGLPLDALDGRWRGRWDAKVTLAASSTRH